MKRFLIVERRQSTTYCSFCSTYGLKKCQYLWAYDTTIFVRVIHVCTRSMDRAVTVFSTSTSSSSMKAFGYFYRDLVHPSEPSQNLQITLDGDSGVDRPFRIIVNLSYVQHQRARNQASFGGVVSLHLASESSRSSEIAFINVGCKEKLENDYFDRIV